MIGSIAPSLENIRFREAGFDELLQDATLPDFDIICPHGVYSWISPKNRRTVVALIRWRLKSGGLLYISYDAMPRLGRDRAAAPAARAAARGDGRRVAGRPGAQAPAGA